MASKDRKEGECVDRGAKVYHAALQCPLVAVDRVRTKFVTLLLRSNSCKFFSLLAFYECS
jgi:hypothetical protein